MSFIKWLVIPAFVAILAFSFAQSAFADAHHLYTTLCIVGWAAVAVVLGVCIYRFGKLYQKKK